jgi:hypothetical protein
VSLKQIYNSALEAGILPHLFWDMTFAEASAVVNGMKLRDSISWNHTATILSMIANVNRSSSSRSYKPEDFHPYVKEVKRPEKDIKQTFQRLKNGIHSKRNSGPDT